MELNTWMQWGFKNSAEQPFNDSMQMKESCAVFFILFRQDVNELPWYDVSKIMCLPPPPEQKPETRPQPPAQRRWPSRPPFSGLPGVPGYHVWRWHADRFHPWQPSPCQPAGGAFHQPDKGPLSRYGLHSPQPVVCLFWFFFVLFNKDHQI